MTIAEVDAVAREVDARRGDRVRAFHQDGKLRFRLALEGRACRRDVAIDLDPEFPRIHLAAAAVAPAQPTPLAAAFRALLQGARLAEAGAVEGERALALTFRRGGEATTLWFEAFGRGANLYLVDAEGRVSATPRGDVAARRHARVGAAFTPVAPRAVDPDLPRLVNVSGAVAGAAAAHAAERELERKRRQLGRQLRLRLRRAERQVLELEDGEARGAEADEWQRRGERLQAGFHRLAPGLERVQVPELGPDGEVRDVWVDLDPRLAPGEQVASCFRRARKARRAREEARRRLPEVLGLAASLRRAAADLETAASLLELQALAERLGLPVDPGGAAASRTPERAKPWRVFVSRDGWEVLVGKDAAGNDRLTLGRARPEDLVLHVRGTPGSHVVVPTPRGKTVPRGTLLDAAELAGFFSSARDRKVVEVDYASRRHVRKPRGARPGQIVLQRLKTLQLRPDEARRQRLLAEGRG